ncbi:MAG: redoxin domain-containing protein [Planctomycetota bacterium]
MNSNIATLQRKTIAKVLFVALVSVIGTAPGSTASAQTQFVSATSTHDVHGHSATVEFEPTWDLVDWSGQLVSSRDYLGQPHLVILHLGGDCLHCVEQLEAFGPVVEDFHRQGVEVLTVSAENRKTLAKSVFEYEGELPFDRMMSDEDAVLFNQLRAFDNFSNEPLHGTFLIDGSGRILWQHTGHHPYMNTDRLLQVATAAFQEEDEEPEPPKIFLDRSPRAVAYQLGRLDNERLLLVERKPDDQKYTPVYSAILTRVGMSPAFRQESLEALVALNESNPAAELLSAISSLKENRQDIQTAGELARMLLGLPAEDLKSQKEALLQAAAAPSEIVRSSAFAALIAAGEAETAWTTGSENEQGVLSCLQAVARIPDRDLKAAQREQVISYFSADNPMAYRAEAIRTLREIPASQAETFTLVAGTVTEEELRTPAVRTLLNVPSEQRDETTSRELVSFLVQLAEDTPAENRTTTEFIDAMQLADQLLALIPVDQARSFRNRLNEVTVRVIRIRTIEDEMRYDTPWFAVEAGRPVQVVLQNDDLAAHNLIITKPGDMKLIADLGLEAGPNNGYQGKQYVPEHPGVMYATQMLQTDQHEALTFNAPAEPGEYPYVCTFPQHWSRMYGVMVVVEDLDAWLKNPVKPDDPTGNSRTLVQNWTMEDLQDGLDSGLEGRSLDIGRKIFVEATCAQCHRLDDEGGAVGPELDEVFAKFEGERTEVLRELLEPSHRIDEEYSMHKVLTLDGLTITGIIVSENDDQIELIDNPESTEPTIILQDDIDDMVKTSKSIMPKGLLDNFTRDEIYEMFYYLEQSQRQ